MTQALLWVLNLSDGDHDLEAIAARSGISYALIADSRTKSGTSRPVGKGRRGARALIMANSALSDRISVVLFPRHATSWVKLFDLACALRDGSKIRPVMILSVPEMSACTTACANGTIDVIDLSLAREADLAINGGTAAAAPRFARKFLRSP